MKNKGKTKPNKQNHTHAHTLGKKKKREKRKGSENLTTFVSLQEQLTHIPKGATARRKKLRIPLGEDSNCSRH